MTHINHVVSYLHRTARQAEAAGLTDGQLLSRFIDVRDEAAFEALAQRHGAVVWGVCRRVLRHHQDCEEVFQATFLVLVRKAASIRPRDMVGNWLYSVAYRTALKARAMSAMRRSKEKQVADIPAPDAIDSIDRLDLQALLDRELNCLPDKYRAAIVLCDLEDKSRKEAARQLKILERTLSSRLTTARRMLAKRLARYGLPVSAGLLATALSPQAALAGGPPAVVSATLKAAHLMAAGQATAGIVSAGVTVLSEGVVKAMWCKNLTALALGSFILSLCAVGTQWAVAALTGPTSQPAPPAEWTVPEEKQVPIPNAVAPAPPEVNLDAYEKRGVKFSYEEGQLVALDATLLSGSGIDDDDAKQFARLTTLRKVALGGSKIGDGGVKELSKLPKLRELNLGATKISDAALMHIGAMKELRVLWLARSPITDGGLTPLTKLAHLEDLGLYQMNISDVGLQAVGRCKALKKLTLTHSRISDNGLAALGGLDKLDTVWLGNTAITDAGLKHLTGWKSLKVIYLHDTTVSDTGMAVLAKLAHLEAVAVANTKVGDVGVQELAKLKDLSFLNLANIRVSDVALRALAGHKKLRELHLQGTQVSDTGLRELRSITSLRILELGSTRSTREGVEALKKMMPQCNIYYPSVFPP